MPPPAELAAPRPAAQVIKEGLPPLWQYMYAQLETLQKGTTPDKMAAIRNLGARGLP